jgi:hypothetical protein
MAPKPAGHALLGALLLAALPPLPSPAQALQQGSPAPTETPTRLLYKLNTRCSLAGAAPRACTVEAIDEGITTLYRHRIGELSFTVRITPRVAGNPCAVPEPCFPGTPSVSTIATCA